MTEPKVVMQILVDGKVVETLWDYGYEEGRTTRILARLLSLQIAENMRLSKQVDELQERGTKMAMARQRVSAFIEKWVRDGANNSHILRGMMDELREANADS
jgi:hypothetical protein